MGLEFIDMLSKYEEKIIEQKKVENFREKYDMKLIKEGKFRLRFNNKMICDILFEGNINDIKSIKNLRFSNIRNKQKISTLKNDLANIGLQVEK